MKKLLKFVAISVAAVALTACHSTQDADQTSDMTGSAHDTGAKTYALNQQSGLSGVDVNGGGADGDFQVNAMQAPANQVYYFAFDKSAVSASDMQAITVQANYLVTHKSAKVRLEGNTDNRGSREYNIGLGWRRAQAVANILKQQGVRPSQIQMVSYGKEHPAVNGDNQHAWSLNRRVELIYVQK